MPVLGNSSVWTRESFGEELIDTTVGDLLDQQAERFCNEPALIYRYPEMGIDLCLSYGALRDRVDRLARGLIALDVGPGDKVAVLAANLPEWILLEMAVPKIGAILVTVNTNTRRADLEYVLKHADVHTLVMMGDFRGNSYAASMADIAPELARQSSPWAPLQCQALPALRHVILIQESVPATWLSLQHVEELSDTVDNAKLRTRQRATRPQDVFQIQFTSGTTGNPKGVMITHHAAINNGRLFASRAGVRQSDRLVSAMPLFHTAGNVMEVFGVLSNGAALVKAISFDARKMLELIQSEHATILSAVPTMVIAMLQQQAVEPRGFDTSSLRFVISGGTPIPVPVMEQVRSVFGAQPMIGFGMTEASPMVTGTLQGDSFELKSATVGIPLPHTDVKLIDTQGQVVPLGQAGELLIRGYLVMQGYYKMPDKTQEAIDAEGWLHSGDLAIMDSKGYLRIAGRIKDMVIRGGENVYPAEVEDFLMRHPAIKQAQVVGIPDAYMGEETAAFIILHEGAGLSEAAFREHCKAGLARHKLPKYFRFVADYPLTPSGKVKKFELRAQLLAELDDAAVHA
jgi:fatty-acyl-CoA synthase